MKSLLGEKLRYLADEEIAKQIISGTYEIPVNLDPATTLVLEEIGRMGVYDKRWRRRDNYLSRGF